MKDVAKEVNDVIKEINKMKPEERLEKLQKIGPELLEKRKVKTHELPELENAHVGKTLMRMAPYPSQYYCILEIKYTF